MSLSTLGWPLACCHHASKFPLTDDDIDADCPAAFAHFDDSGRQAMTVLESSTAGLFQEPDRKPAAQIPAQDTACEAAIQDTVGTAQVNTEPPEDEPFYVAGWKPASKELVPIVSGKGASAEEPSKEVPSVSSSHSSPSPQVLNDAASSDPVETSQKQTTVKKKTAQPKKAASSGSDLNNKAVGATGANTKAVGATGAKVRSKSQPKSKQAVAEPAMVSKKVSDAGTTPKTGDKKKAAPKKVSQFQKIRDREAKFEAEKHKYSQLVDDIIAGKYKTTGKGQPGGNMRIEMPLPIERTQGKMLILEGFRSKYSKMNRYQHAAACPSAVGPEALEAPPQVDNSDLGNNYSTKEAEGLKIEGGHRPLPRPANVELPKDFGKKVGTMDLKTLQTYDCTNNRKLVSIYGDIFDVSDRPDKYGEHAPYSWMAGHDLTWGFVSGMDVPEQVDQMYDLWKIAPKEFRDKKLQCILAWVAFYEYEYGAIVGELDEYKNENGLKGPPMEDSNGDCSIM